MTVNELRDALRLHRLDEGLSYRELEARARGPRLTHTTIFRFLTGHKISDVGAHALYKYWLSVVDGA
jgi:hypothetical protein